VYLIVREVKNCPAAFGQYRLAKSRKTAASEHVREIFMSFAAMADQLPGFAGPLYAQVASYLRERISAAEWSPATPLPNEALLAKDIGVSVGTVRKALEMLESERLIQRRQGRGTFVLDATDQADVERFVSVAAEGRRLKGEVVGLTATMMAADADVASRLSLRSSEPVVRFDFSWRAPFSVRAIETVYVSQNRFPGIEDIRELTTPFLFPIYRRTYRTIVHSTTERVSCMTADGSQSSFLSATPGQPLLKVERQARTSTGQIVEWAVRTMNLGGARFIAQYE
jgi:GntR family transcriptional regulator